MGNLFKFAVAAAAVLCAAGSASATVFNFSADLTNGPNTGLLTGTLDLPLVGDGTAAATNLTILSYPAGVALTPNDVATTWTTVADNTFTVTGGAITSFLFFSGGGIDAGQSVLCLSSGGSDASGDFVCPSDVIELHQTIGVFAYNLGGASGITFSSTSTIPEPATWAMMLVGFGGIGAVIRRSKQAALAA